MPKGVYERPKRKPTGKQKMFCEEYVANGYNASRAYVAAYGGSLEDAQKNQWRMFQKPWVNDYIKEIQKERFDALHINAEKIANELNRIAFEDTDASNSDKMRALELLQKQLGLQTQKVDARVEVNNINIDIEDE